MRKFLVFFVMTFVSLLASAQEVDLEKKWGAVVKAIAQVESEERPDQVSSNGLYVGYLQMSKILVRQCNQILGTQAYTYNDRYDKQKSIEMFIVFQEHFNKEGNMEKAIRLWCSGDLKCMNRKRATNGYYRRVMRKYTEMASR
jgi:hypothetical protein